MVRFCLFFVIKVKKKEVQEERNREKSVQKAVLDIKKKYGKNAVLKGMSLIEGATAVARNRQIGGHKA
jgi:DNA polymerase V